MNHVTVKRNGTSTCGRNLNGILGYGLERAERLMESLDVSLGLRVDYGDMMRVGGYWSGYRCEVVSTKLYIPWGAQDQAASDIERCRTEYGVEPTTEESFYRFWVHPGWTDTLETNGIVHEIPKHFMDSGPFEVLRGMKPLGVDFWAVVSHDMNVMMVNVLEDDPSHLRLLSSRVRSVFGTHVPVVAGQR